MQTVSVPNWLRQLIRAQMLIAIGFCLDCAFGGFMGGFTKALALSQVF
jgi:hypothetical protein